MGGPQHQRDHQPAEQFRVLLRQNLVADLQNRVAALAGHDPAHEHHVVDVVELGILDGGVGKIKALERILTYSKDVSQLRENND